MIANPMLVKTNNSNSKISSGKGSKKKVDGDISKQKIILNDKEEDDNDNGSFDLYVGAEEFLNEFGGNAIKSPFQDGHYIYTVIAGSGSGTSSVSPILYIADLESPKNFNKKLQP